MGAAPKREKKKERRQGGKGDAVFSDIRSRLAGGHGSFVSSKDMNSPKLTIEVKVYHDDELLARREAENWEVAEMNLDSLRRWYEEKQVKSEMAVEEVEE